MSDASPTGRRRVNVLPFLLMKATSNCRPFPARRRARAWFFLSRNGATDETIELAQRRGLGPVKEIDLHFQRDGAMERDLVLTFEAARPTRCGAPSSYTRDATISRSASCSATGGSGISPAATRPGWAMGSILDLQ